MQKAVEIFLQLPDVLDMIDLNDYAGVFNFAYDRRLDNSAVRNLKNILEDALDIDLDKMLQDLFLAKFIEKGLPKKSSYFWDEEGDMLKIQTWLTNGALWNNTFGLHVPEALNVLIEAGYNIDTDPEYGWILYE